MNCLSIVSAAALLFPYTNSSGSQTTDSSYTLTGTIKGVPTAWVYLLHAETKKLDSAAYHAWHSKGFTILGISLDDNKDRRLAAIKKDGKIIAKDLRGDDLEKKLAELVH